MFAFVSSNLKYPYARICISGVVVISFVVEPDGKITSKKILKGLDEKVDKEALSMIDKMPLWIPGKCQGKSVPTKYVLPVRVSYT